MLTIKDWQGKDRYLSDEIYELTEDSGSPKYKKGTLVRLASGVDNSNTPGYHFNSDYKTVCRIGAKTAEGVGVFASSLKQVA